MSTFLSADPAGGQNDSKKQSHRRYRLSFLSTANFQYWQLGLFSESSYWSWDYWGLTWSEEHLYLHLESSQKNLRHLSAQEHIRKLFSNVEIKKNLILF